MSSSTSLNAIRLTSTYSMHTLKNADSYMLQMYRVLKKTVKAYCKITRAFIDCSGLLVLKEYVKRWRAFSVSISATNSAYKPFALLLNDIYNAKMEDGPTSPPFTTYRLMTVLWRRHVFTPLIDKVINELLSMF